MDPLFVLVHSPSVGPATWTPVAPELARRGYAALVPSLLHVGAGEPPVWRRVAAAVADGLAGVPLDRPVVLAAHSNAGVFVPVIRAAVRHPVAASVFVDALLPARQGATALAEGEFVDFLNGIVEPDGRLPRWTDWWGDEDVSRLFPDEETRRTVSEEQPRLPLSYYEQVVPVPAGWDDHPCGYLLFAPAYERMADEARARGWPVTHIPGEHLHQIVDPAAVTEALISFAVTSVHAGEVDPAAHNRAAWDRRVDEDDEWTRPVPADVIARARTGDWSVVLIGHQPVDRSWLPADLTGVDVLCLASGGGQQGPVLAASGARMTVFDNSPRQLSQDELVAARDGLSLRTVLGDMRELGAFRDESFDVVFHPVSNLFCPELAPVWRECFRVLRPGGVLLSGFLNPDLYIFDAEALDTRGEFVVRHPLPYADLTHLAPEERERVFGPGAPVEYSHTLTEQITGQLAAGFVITGFAEAPHHANATARYLSGYFTTRAVKPPLS